MRAKLKIETRTNTHTSPSWDDLAEKDYLNLADEDILQPMPDELEMVDSLDLDFPTVDISISGDTNSVDTKNLEGERTELYDIVAGHENEEDSGEFFEQPERGVEQEIDAKNSSILTNRKLLLVLTGLTLMVLLAIFFIITHDTYNSIIDVDTKPGSVIRSHEAFEE